LIQKGVDQKIASFASQQLTELLSEDYPEVEVIPAVRELRTQLETTARSKKWSTDMRPKFSRSLGVRPLDFFLQNYADLIESGEINSNRLVKSDPNLYLNLRMQLSADNGSHDEPSSVSGLIEKYTGVRSSLNRLQDRIDHCATVLNTDRSTAARFFTNVRPDHVRRGR